MRRGEDSESYDGGGWPGDTDDFADYNQMEADDYAYEGMEDQWLDGSYEE